ncbi:exodeoxyribonuclease 7 large subunit [Mesorhizobium sp. L-8-10]|uniref:exodeoxyribonuclease VII large subunit n=1 Tax=unclassified Mesorhizobium TaxID=325217 RepID=UPI00192619D7|nr:MULTISPECIES: exodeoxyribonuclease VII large subunit [unclassified Mesorhizobium]BCH26620.1 exodeoxyribonuclease 7 large subunit [Mesorhizobium sp. L-8-3]BCH34603.1 exodeoxyribonuclease 7 large subunit [Mesorhizobium sp. L-8-10]
MSDFLANDSKTNAAEYTVSEISGALKRVVEDAFGNVRVRGEISGYRGPHSSGHAYFSLKDDRARIEAVVWKTTMSRLKFRPEEGMEVIATGRLTTYPGSSKYQIVIDNLEPAGAGALMALLEERKRRLAAEGLFDQDRKRRLPYMPGIIGVVTSPTGAVIRDILHRIRDRFPLHVLVWPVRVQGETAGAEVTAAVEGFNALAADGPIPRPDVLIVARGGGSLEDLWGFNDEGLARAVAASKIPVISAVGHETDWTLVDFVADMRAPTPTGAAEFAVPVKAELQATLASLAARLSGATSRGVERKRQALRAAGRALPSPDQLLALPRRRFDEATARLGRALVVSTERKRARLDAARIAPSLLARRLAEARRHLDHAAGRLPKGAQAGLRERRRHLATLNARMTVEPIARHAAELRREEQRIAVRLRRAVDGLLAARRTRFSQAERMLSTVSYQSILERGFAVVRDADGQTVKRAAALGAGAPLSIQFADGVAGAVATGSADTPKPRPKPAPKDRSGGQQGSLF